MSESAADFHADDAEATVLERPLRLRAVDMAIGRDDPGLLDAFLAAKGPGDALRLWFGITLPSLPSGDLSCPHRPVLFRSSCFPPLSP
jgi:type VI secretion system protein ImpD